MRKQRKHYTAAQKLALLRRHLIDKAPVSDLCEEHGLQPTVLYRWQKDLFENGACSRLGPATPGLGASRPSRPSSPARTRSWPN